MANGVLGSILSMLISNALTNEDPSSQGMSNYGYWNNYITPNQEYWQTQNNQPMNQYGFLTPNQNFNFGNMSLLDMLSSYRPYSQWGGFFQ